MIITQRLPASIPEATIIANSALLSAVVKNVAGIKV
jgi:hypothetical protein